MLNAIIVEDEANSREILRNYLAKYCPQVTLIGEASNINEAYELVTKREIQLVFLDVEMPFGNAFDFLDKVPNREFETVFVTAYNQYAMDALNNHAAYYLMKPINIDELIKSVEYVDEIVSKEKALDNRILQPKIHKIEGKITVPDQDGFQILNVKDILYCKADSNYTEVFLTDKKLVICKTLKYFETALADFAFARIHKSYMVNVNEISKYKKGKGGSITLSNGKELMISASRKKELLGYF